MAIQDGEGFSVLSLPLGLLWVDDELTSLFSKEQEIHIMRRTQFDDGSRPQAVAWISKVADHYGFSTLTTLLAINYLDRFLCSSRTFPHFQRDKQPSWMIQLVAVTCLSLAAKVDEIQVPLLLDLQIQVGDSKYIFEARTIQRMELLVLSALQWRMHPVTPLSFIDHITRRLRLRTHLHWEFQRRCEQLLLAVVSDSRSVGWVPSVLATATMMHVMEGVEPCNSVQYCKNQLQYVLKVTQADVSECYKLVVEVSSGGTGKDLKRRWWCNDDLTAPRSPSGVMDGLWSCDSSNDSWDWNGNGDRHRV